MFIKLTRSKERFIYININCILSMTPYNKNTKTYIHLMGEDYSEDFDVKETPEEIMELINDRLHS